MGVGTQLSRRACDRLSCWIQSPETKPGPELIGTAKVGQEQVVRGRGSTIHESLVKMARKPPNEHTNATVFNVSAELPAYRVQHETFLMFGNYDEICVE